MYPEECECGHKMNPPTLEECILEKSWCKQCHGDYYFNQEDYKKGLIDLIERLVERVYDLENPYNTS